MKKLFYAIYIFFITTTLSSCVETVDNIKLPEATPKLVIGAFISPQDTVITVTVTKSSPLGTVIIENNVVSDAQVILSEGSNSISIAYDVIKKKYWIQANLFPIQAGKTYNLSVRTPDGNSAKASCTIPAIANTSISSSLDSAVSSNDLIYKIRPEWNDVPGQEDFYRVYAELVVVQEWGNTPYYNYYPFYSDYELTVISDRNKDGKKLSSGIGEYYYYFNNIVKDRYINLSLLTVDRNYYEYYRTEYSALNADGNPFAEPVIIYSNIVGGLGIFAGYQRHTITIDVL